MENNEKAVHSSFWSNLFNASTEKDDIKKNLYSIPIFQDLKEKDISIITGMIHYRNYLKGEYIFYQGDPGIGLYIIREGEVSIIDIDSAGHVQSLANLSKGDFFGELALIEDEKRSATAIAKSDAKIAIIFKPDLDEFIERYPAQGIKILKGILQIVTYRLRKLNDEMISNIK